MAAFHRLEFERFSFKDLEKKMEFPVVVATWEGADILFLHLTQTKGEKGEYNKQLLCYFSAGLSAPG